MLIEEGGGGDASDTLRAKEIDVARSEQVPLRKLADVRNEGIDLIELFVYWLLICSLLNLFL